MLVVLVLDIWGRRSLIEELVLSLSYEVPPILDCELELVEPLISRSLDFPFPLPLSRGECSPLLLGLRLVDLLSPQ